MQNWESKFYSSQRFPGAPGAVCFQGLWGTARFAISRQDPLALLELKPQVCNSCLCKLGLFVGTRCSHNQLNESKSTWYFIFQPVFRSGASNQQVTHMYCKTIPWSDCKVLRSFANNSPKTEDEFLNPCGRTAHWYWGVAFEGGSFHLKVKNTIFPQLGCKREHLFKSQHQNPSAFPRASCQ